MKVTVIKRGRFESAHANIGFGEGHKCTRIHGHNFEYFIEVESELDLETGISLDFSVLSEIGKELDSIIDHRLLNEVPPFDKYLPSAEFIAFFIFKFFEVRLFDKGYVLGHLPQKLTLQETENSKVSLTREQYLDMDESLGYPEGIQYGGDIYEK